MDEIKELVYKQYQLKKQKSEYNTKIEELIKSIKIIKQEFFSNLFGGENYKFYLDDYNTIIVKTDYNYAYLVKIKLYNVGHDYFTYSLEFNYDYFLKCTDDDEKLLLNIKLGEISKILYDNKEIIISTFKNTNFKHILSDIEFYENKIEAVENEIQDINTILIDY